jgi:hypothetical protein
MKKKKKKKHYVTTKIYHNLQANLQSMRMFL